MSLLCGTGIPVAAEDLDEALAAQKKKAQRRVYSEYARIENRDLAVPRTKTEEEKALDKKLREMDARAEEGARSEIAQSLMNPGRSVSSASVRAVPEENKTWLAAAILDETASEKLPDMAEDNWLTQEMDRQKAMQDAKKENEMVEKLLREQPRLQTTPSGVEPFKNYQFVPQSVSDNQNRFAAGSSFMGSTPEQLFSAASFRQTSKREETPALPTFSPQTARPSFSLDQNPLQSTMGRLINPAPGAPSSGISPGLSSRLDPRQTAPLTPLQKIKKASPIYQSDPFADDHMPKIKTSIWE